MNHSLSSLLWCPVQVTALAVAALMLDAVVGRRRPAARALIAVSTLVAVVGLSATALFPWPAWEIDWHALVTHRTAAVAEQAADSPAPGAVSELQAPLVAADLPSRKELLKELSRIEEGTAAPLERFVDKDLQSLGRRCGGVVSHRNRLDGGADGAGAGRGAAPIAATHARSSIATSVSLPTSSALNLAAGKRSSCERIPAWARRRPSVGADRFCFFPATGGAGPRSNAAPCSRTRLNMCGAATFCPGSPLSSASRCIFIIR